MLISRFSLRRTGSPPMIGTITSGCGGKAVAPHHRCDRGEVGWASGRSVEDGRDLAEVVGAEDSGCHDRQRLRVDIARVVELVDGAAWNEKRLSGPDVDRRAFDRPGQHSLEPVDRLLVAVVTVPGCDFRAGRYVELEDRDRTSRLLALDQEANRHPTDLDLVAHRRCHHALPLMGLVKWLDDIWRRAISQVFLLTRRVTRNRSARRSSAPSCVCHGMRCSSTCSIACTRAASGTSTPHT